MIHFRTFNTYVILKVSFYGTWNILISLYPTEAKTQLMFYGVTWTGISVPSSILMHNKYYHLYKVVKKNIIEKSKQCEIPL